MRIIASVECFAVDLLETEEDAVQFNEKVVEVLVHLGHLVGPHSFYFEVVLPIFLIVLEDIQGDLRHPVLEGLHVELAV